MTEEPMSEFDKLAGDVKKFAQDHPEQVEKGEQAVEGKLGLRQHDDAPQQAGAGQAAVGQGSGQQDQGSQQAPPSDQQPLTQGSRRAGTEHAGADLAGKENVEVTDVPDSRVQEPTDVIIKVTSTAISGSGLHLYGVLHTSNPATFSATRPRASWRNRCADPQSGSR
jgi:hypothetical protein